MADQKEAAPAVEADEQTTANDVDLAEPTAEELVGLPPDPAQVFDDLVAEESEEEGEDEGDVEADDTEEEESEEEESESESDSTSQEDETEEAEAAPEEDEPTEPLKYTPDEIQALYKSQRELLSLKGRQGQALGDKDRKIAELEERLARVESKGQADTGEADGIPTTKEEWDALFATEPLKATELYIAIRENQRVQAEATQKQRESMETAAVTPEVGAEIFVRSNGIKSFDEWSVTPEGLAVNKAIASNKRAQVALLGAINTGDAEIVAEIMTEALKAVRGKTVVEKGKQVAKAQSEVAQATKPKAVARTGRPIHPKAAKALTEMSSEDILQMDDRTFARLYAGR